MPKNDQKGSLLRLKNGFFETHFSIFKFSDFFIAFWTKIWGPVLGPKGSGTLGKKKAQKGPKKGVKVCSEEKRYYLSVR